MSGAPTSRAAAKSDRLRATEVPGAPPKAERRTSLATALRDFLGRLARPIRRFAGGPQSADASDFNLTWVPLGDKPISASRLAEVDAGRTRPAVDAVAAHLRGCIRGSYGPDAATRLGLFGGLGQGKSSAVACAVNEVRRDGGLFARTRGWLCGDPIALFNISHYTPKDLEWRLLLAVVIRRLLRNLLLLSLVTLLAVGVWGHWASVAYGTEWAIDLVWWVRYLVLSIVPPWVDAAGLTTVLLSTVFPALLLYVYLQVTADSLHASLRDRIFYQLACLLHAQPKVIVVDDLDRAATAQQRAFLRALQRTSEQLDCGVVVCMDDTALRASGSDPDSPEQLLRKTLNAQFRLPERHREDVVCVVVAVNAEAASLNSSYRASVLTHPQWLADLVRVLVLAGPVGEVSPRLVKRVINDVGLSASRMAWVRQDGGGSRPCVDAWCALLRLHVLLRVAPHLQTMTAEVQAALEANQLAGFERLLDQARLSSPVREGALRFLNGTRMMQPSDEDGWFRLLSGQGSPSLQANPAAAAPPDALRHDLRVGDGVYWYSQLCIEALRDGLCGRGLSWRPNLAVQRERYFAIDTPAVAARVYLDDGDIHQTKRLPHSWWQGRSEDGSGPIWSHEWLCWIASRSALDAHFGFDGVRQMRQWAAEAPPAVRRDLIALIDREHAGDAQAWAETPEVDREAVLQGDARAKVAPSIAVSGKDLPQVLMAHAAASPLLRRQVVHQIRPVDGEVDLTHFSSPGTIAPLGQDHLNAQVLARLFPPLHSRRAPSNTASQGYDKPLAHAIRYLGLTQRPPDGALHHWQHADQSLTTVQALGFLVSLAHIPVATANRYAWEFGALRPWVGKRLPVSLAPSLLSSDPASWSGRLHRLTDEAWQLVLLLAVLEDFAPHGVVAQKALTGNSGSSLLPLLLALSQEQHEISRELPPVPPTRWMREHDAAVLLALMVAYRPPGGADDRQQLSELIEDLLGDGTHDVLARAGWPPLVEVMRRAQPSTNDLSSLPERPTPAKSILPPHQVHGSRYAERLAYLAGADVPRRSLGILGIVEAANAAPNVARRNLYWSDAVLLSVGQWSRDTSIDPLDKEAVAARAGLLDAIDTPEPLRELTATVLDESWATFEEFKGSEPGSNDFVGGGSEDWLGDFQRWFNTYLPLIMLKLPEDAGEADAELKQRINWLVSRAFPDPDPIDGPGTRFLDEAWSYARDHWNDRVSTRDSR